MYNGPLGLDKQRSLDLRFLRCTVAVPLSLRFYLHGDARRPVPSLRTVDPTPTRLSSVPR